MIKEFDEVNKEIERMRKAAESFNKVQRIKGEYRKEVKKKYKGKMLMDELDGLFDKNIKNLPNRKKRLLKNKYPMLFTLWDVASLEDRKKATIDEDYQNDLATQEEGERILKLIAEREDWEQKGTPTALDLAKKEERLKEIQDGLESLYNGTHPLCCAKYRKGIEIVDTEPPQLKRIEQIKNTEERNNRLQHVMNNLANKKKERGEPYTKKFLAYEMTKIEEFKKISKDVILRATKKPK